ncbi:hypothetical protein CSA56_08570 [candidate division KSB3 bacterium]|uniref:Uncharacterized protein n=1 Tax=candidate division KSB3 bacterium TaxID=2044937 RepID=A0A2G6KGQ3_9BACT|nr:MAG: hypothetical protein CSA56_08570 [candidate division KSB3 bacterium]
MFSLMCSHYENVSQRKFLNDLDEKTGVILLRDPTGTVQGFTTFLLMGHEHNTGIISAIYSGDTIVDRLCWGQIELFRMFGGLFRQCLEQQSTPVYWFLLSKGVKTYLMLPLFFQNFYPNYLAEAPLNTQKLMQELARKKFGPCYHHEQGIVRMIPQADRLQKEFAVIPENKRQNPHVRFFTERNPGYLDGDELVCLARIVPSNFTRMAQRFVKENNR